MEPDKIIQISLLWACAYLMGAVPWGLVLTRKFSAVDINHAGSGNIGATNVLRTAGIALGLLTLAADVLKGALPALIADRWIDPHYPGREIFVGLVMLGAFLGHLYPVYLKFRGGGKGVATAAGTVLVVSPASLLIILAVFILVVLWRRRVSLASLAAVGLLPPVLWFQTASPVLGVVTVVMAGFICLRHIENIRRLRAGTEPALWGK